MKHSVKRFCTGLLLAAICIMGTVGVSGCGGDIPVKQESGDTGSVEKQQKAKKNKENKYEEGNKKAGALTIPSSKSKSNDASQDKN